MKTFEERFWSKVDVAGPDECWFWTASDNGVSQSLISMIVNGKVRHVPS